MYGDDVDWCRRCWNAGWQVMFFPGAESIHDRGAITAPYPVRFAVAQQRSILYYWAKYHGWPGLWGIRTLLFCRYVLRYLAGGFAGLVRVGSSGSQSRKQVLSACLRALLSERVPHKA
jgi:GT2 family glycosyltransferase